MSNPTLTPLKVQAGLSTNMAITCQRDSPYTANYGFPTTEATLLPVLETILSTNYEFARSKGTSGEATPFQQTLRPGYAQRLCVDIDVHSEPPAGLFDWYRRINLAVLEAFSWAYPQEPKPKWRFAVKRDPTQGAVIYYDAVLPRGVDCKAILRHARESLEDLPEGLFDENAAGRRFLGVCKPGKPDSAYHLLKYGVYPAEKNARITTTPKLLLWSLPYVPGRATVHSTQSSQFERAAEALLVRKPKYTGEALSEEDFDEALSLVNTKYGFQLEINRVTNNIASCNADVECPWHQCEHGRKDGWFYIIKSESGGILFGCARDGAGSPHKEWLKESVSAWKQAKLTIPDLESILDGEQGHANIFLERLRGKLFVRNEAKMHMWNEKRLLWLEITPKGLGVEIGTQLHAMMSDAIVRLTKETSEKANKETDKVIKSLVTLRARWGTCGHGLRVAQHIIKNFAENEDSNEFYATRLVSDEYTQHFFAIEGGLAVDLRTGEIMERTPKHIFAVESPQNPLYSTPEDMKFIEDWMYELFNGDLQKVKHLQTLLGYALSGCEVKKRFDLFVGKADSGKSTVLTVLGEIMGKFHTHLSSSVMMKTQKVQGEGPDPSLMAFYGRRCAVSAELEDGSRLNSKKVKELTGGDFISARENSHKGDPIVFVNKAKLFVCTNFLPEFDADDSGMRTRMYYLDFPIRYPKPEEYNPADPTHRKVDDDFKKKIPRNAFLAWIIEGAKRFYAEGIVMPESLTQLKVSNIRKLNEMQQFIDECIERTEPTDYTLVSELYESFSLSYKDPSVNCNAAFSKKLSEKLGITSVRKKIMGQQKMVFLGIKLRD